MIDYQEVLADLRRRKVQLKRQYEGELAEIDAAIGAIEKVVPGSPCGWRDQDRSQELSPLSPPIAG